MRWKADGVERYKEVDMKDVQEKGSEVISQVSGLDIWVVSEALLKQGT